MTKSITFAQTDKVADLGREAVKTAISRLDLQSTNVQIGIISNGGEFKNRVEEAIKTIILQMTESKEITDEVKNFKYSDEYYVKPINEQIAIIASVLELDPTYAQEFIKSLPPLPKRHRWFAIPKEFAIGKINYPMINDHAEQYCVNRTANIANIQHGDIIVIPAQLGAYHREKLIRRARGTTDLDLL